MPNAEPSSLSQSKSVPQPAAPGNDQDFEVERIVDYKEEEDNGVYAKVRWVGYGEQYDTWEPIGSLLDNAKETVEDFLAGLDYNVKLRLLEITRKRGHTSSEKLKSRSKSGSRKPEQHAPKKAPSNKRKSNSRNQSVSVSEVKEEVPECSSKRASVTPNRKSLEVRDSRHWVNDYSDEESTEKEVKVRISPPRQDTNSSMPLGSLSNTTAYTVTTCSGFEPILTRPNSTLIAPNSQDNNTRWSVTGIFRQKGSLTKMVKMQHKITLESRVLEERDAHELEPWALTKYLLDRIEF